MRAGFADMNSKLGSIRWGFALAIPVTIAMTILIVGVIALVFQIVL